MLRSGPDGDRFGLRRARAVAAKLRRAPHGMVLDEHIATGVLGGASATATSECSSDPRDRGGDRALAAADGAPGAIPLRLIGMRELRSHNSWMHNSPLLMRGGRVHARARSTRTTPRRRASPTATTCGSLGVAARSRCRSKLTDEMTPGTVAVPHGWGHRGGWRVANGAGGVNVNVLAPSDPDGLERLAGMAFLNGIPVRVEPVAAHGLAAEPAATAAV